MRQTAYINGQILTIDKRNTIAEAVLVSDGEIEKVGTRGEVQEAMAPGGQIMDLEGKTMMPGFIDGHSHLTAVAYEYMFANACPPPKGACDSTEALIRELRRQLRKKTPKKDRWFIAMGCEPERYPDGREISRKTLDQVSRKIPVCVLHASGRRGFFNSAALKVLGIDRDTPDWQKDGVWRETGSGEPLGILEEKAFFAACEKMPLPSLGKTLQGLRKAVKLYASYGITTVQEARMGEAEHELLHMAGMMGLLELDVVSYLEPSAALRLLKAYPARRNYEKHSRLGGYKIFLDGSLSAKTAWLSAPYKEAPEGQGPDYCGAPAMKDEQVLEHMRLCLKYGWQLHAHANGDAAIEQFIRCYTRAKEFDLEAPELRPVLVHCQTVREEQLDRMKALGILPSYFLDQLYYYGDYYEQQVLGPERADRLNPAFSAMERSMTFTLHQDSPSAPPDMLFSLHNAVNRRTSSGRQLGAGQRISVEEALRAITIYGAYQMFEERKKGSIEEGKTADLVILDQNPLKTAPGKLREIKVLQTIKEGKTVYRRTEAFK